MYGEALLESLIEEIYEAAAGATGWSDPLHSLAAALGGGSPSLFWADTSRRESDIVSCSGVDEKTKRAYREYYHARNVWIDGARPLLRPGSVRSSHCMCSRRKFLASEWYADFCRPLNWTQGLAATVLQDGTATLNIGFFTDDRRPPYDADDIGLIRALTTHLIRGFRMQRRLAASHAWGRTLEEMLHALPEPALLATSHGKVLFMNAAAEALVRSCDGLAVEAGELRAVRADDTKSLRILMGTAARSSAREGAGFAEPLRISRPSGRDPLEVFISPLVSPVERISREPSVVAVLVTGPLREEATGSFAVASLYDLTPTETRVALALGRGERGKRVCETLNISYNTLKTHARRIYAKTGTRSQSELVRFLADRGSRMEDHPIG